MNVSARSYVAAGLAALTAGVIAIPTSVAPPAPPPAPVHQARVALVAATRPISAPVAPPAVFVVVPRQQTVVPTAATRAATQASPTAAAAPAAQAALAGFPGIQDAIINGYNVVNPWIDYGVNLAQYAVGWIPVAGIFAPQIGIFYYNLIEPIMTSAVYNLAYVIGGSVGLVQGVSNVINDSITAGIGFVNAEINWALGFLPPLPPFPMAAAQTTAFKTAEVAAEPKTEPTTELKTVATGEAAVVEKHKSSVVDSVETATEAAAEPVTPKSEAEPAQKPESATTDSSGGVAAQGEVRGGTEGAADAKRPEEKKPEEKKPDASKDDEKGDEVAASTAGKPAEPSPSDEAKTVDPGKDADAGKDAGKAKV